MHIFNCTSDSIPYGPWLDCFHQQTDPGPYWATLSDGTRDIAWRQILTWNNHYMYIPVWKWLTRRKATARSLCHRLGVTAGWPSDVRTILWAQQGHRAATLRAPYDYCKSLQSFLGQNKNLKSYVVLTITVRGSYDVTAMCLRATGLRFFSNLSLCGVAGKSVWWSQGLPAEAARKRWFGHRTGIVY